MNTSKHFKNRFYLALTVLLFMLWWFCLPRVLFNPSYSILLESEQGNLLGAKIADDGQWRFPQADTVPYKLSTAIVQFEDQRFWQHLGFDIRAFFRALRQNWQAGHIVSGGSTVSMQVIRLSKNNPPRTVFQKIKEVFLALRLECRYDKEEILNLWATHAPYGGNVVGFETAAWRYYGKGPALLTWAEAATLAVLPNSPALIHPGKNRSFLLQKRNRLLNRLRQNGYLEELDYELALLEPLPQKPLPLPQIAPHLLTRIAKEKGAGRHIVTLNVGLQENLSKIAARHQRQLAENSIHNLAVLLVDNKTGKTLSYVGNAPNIAAAHSPHVDIITAPRSPGSLLKPILYSLALQDGTILPKQLLGDIPTTISGFRPENYYLNYSGVMPADKALAKSLNIPFILLLQNYGVPLFHDALQKWQFDFINAAPSHYGLSLILGGCEVSLWQAVSWYSGMARLLNNYYPLQGQYQTDNWRNPYFIQKEKPTTSNVQRLPPIVGAGAAWHTISAMEKLERPDSQGEWESFSNSRRIAWKTGTSFGFRDAWALGITPDYTIGIWVGNADGEGRPGLVGVKAAAPILFDVLEQLPTSKEWFEYPFDDCREVLTCKESGFRASVACPIDTLWSPKSGLDAPTCPYHKMIHLDVAEQYRVHQMCVNNNDIVAKPWFILPPLEAYYYQKRNLQYRAVPPWKTGCSNNQMADQPMQLIYPRHPSNIRIPINLDGTPSAAVFTVAHQDSEATIHWHLDAQYLGTTAQFHSMELNPPIGQHQLVLTDQKGNRLEQGFRVVE